MAMFIVECGTHTYLQTENILRLREIKGSEGMIPKEFWERFKKEKIAVNCQTEDEAKDFVKQCYGNGIRWCDISSGYNDVGYQTYKEKICYCYGFYNKISFIPYYAIKTLTYSSMDLCENQGFQIIPYSEINKSIKEENKIMNINGINIDQQIVLRKDYPIYLKNEGKENIYHLVNCNKGKFLYDSKLGGTIELENYNIDGTHKYNPNLDICVLLIMRSETYNRIEGDKAKAEKERQDKLKAEKARRIEELDKAYVEYFETCTEAKEKYLKTMGQYCKNYNIIIQNTNGTIYYPCKIYDIIDEIVFGK